MQIPDEIKSRDSIVLLPRKINEVIRYLRATRLVSGPGIAINESPAGTTVRSTEKGKKSASGGSGEIAIGVLTSGPTNGYGPAVWKAIKVNADGTWTVTGDEIPVVVPLLK